MAQKIPFLDKCAKWILKLHDIAIFGKCRGGGGAEVYEAWGIKFSQSPILRGVVAEFAISKIPRIAYMDCESILIIHVQSDHSFPFNTIWGGNSETDRIRDLSGTWAFSI